VWSPGGMITSSVFVTPPSTTTYTVTYNLSDCSPANGSGTVTVNPPTNTTPIFHD
jgi:hypothetical protein